MFKRSFASKDRAGKAVKPSKRSFREHAKMKLQDKLNSPPVGRWVTLVQKPRGGHACANHNYGNSTLTSPIVTLVVGREQRLFAAHEDVLSLSPFFVAALRGQFFESSAKQVQLPDEYVCHESRHTMMTSLGY